MKLKLGIVAIVLIVVCLVTGTNAQAPVTTSTTTTTTVAATTTTTSTTTTLPPYTHPECVEFLALAVTLGWGAENLPMLERVMWKESRCQPHQLNASDPNGGSIGLTQVNRFWCLPSRYYPDGYLQTYGVLATCDDLFNPSRNLVAALAIFEYADGWSQWGL